MADAAHKQLKDGDAFPALSGESVAHGKLSLPDAIPADRYGVILAYRAHW